MQPVGASASSLTHSIFLFSFFLFQKRYCIDFTFFTLDHRLAAYRSFAPLFNGPAPIDKHRRQLLFDIPERHTLPHGLARNIRSVSDCPLPTAYSSRYLVTILLDLLFLLIAFKRASTAQCIHLVCSSRPLFSHVYCFVDKIILSNGHSFNPQSLSLSFLFLRFLFTVRLLYSKSASCFWISRQ